MTIHYRQRVRLMAAAVCLMATGAHLVSAGSYFEMTGLLLVADHIFDVLATVALLALCAALGFRATRSVGPLLEPAELLLLATTLGIGLVATGLLLLGFTVGFTPATQIAFIAGLAWAARPGLRPLVTTGRQLLREDPGGQGLVGLLAITVLPFVVLTFLALAPPSDYDSLAYHLQIPRLWLERGRIYSPSDSQHAAVIGVVQMLYVPLLAIRSVAAPAVLNAALAALLGGATFLFARRYFGAGVAPWASLLLWASTGLSLVAATPRIDVSLALFLFVGHYGFMIALRNPRRELFLLVGAILGFAAGVKMLALPYALALLPLAILLRPAEGRRAGWRQWLTPLSLAGALAFAPWAAKNWYLSHALLYPLGSEADLPAWLLEMEGPAHPQGPTRQDFVRPTRAAFNLKDLVLDPGRLTPENEGKVYHFSLILFALPLAMLLKERRLVAATALPALLYLGMLIVRSPFLNLRYLFPAAAALTVVATAAVLACLRRVVPHSRLLLPVLSLVLLVPTCLTIAHRLWTTGMLIHAIGGSSRAEFLHEAEYEIASHMTAVDAMNRLLPPGSLTLLLFEERAYYLKRPVIRDNWLINWPYLATQLTERPCLSGLPPTHVFVNKGIIKYFLERGLDARLVRWSDFAPFAARCLDLLVETNEFAFYRIKGSPDVPVHPGAAFPPASD